jgi:iron complex transport system permease protein
MMGARRGAGGGAVAAVTLGVAFVCSVLLAPEPVNPFAMDAVERSIVLGIRLPRVVVAALMGGALGASGAVLQGMFRNPLADPYVLGLSSGAALFAAVGLLVGASIAGPLTIPLLAFAGAMATGAFVGAMGYRGGGMQPERLLLAGIGVGFLFTAVLMLVMSVSSAEGVRRAVLWIYGDLSLADWSVIPAGGAFIALGMGIALSRARALNGLMLGDDLAHSLGFAPRREALLLFVAASLMTAASVALGGMVGFIGLLMPHVMRFFVGPDNRVLLPATALGGATLLVVADLIGRSIASPLEFPAGVVTAIVGAPYFLYLLRRRDAVGL